MKITVLLGFLFAFSSPAHAKDLCKLYANWSPLPKWYDNLCRKGGGGGSLRAVVGGAFSSFADAFNLNPSSLPTIEIPFGVEVIASVPVNAATPTPSSGAFPTSTPSSTETNARVSINAIKGLNGIGFGIATDTDNSIFSNRANHAQIGTYSSVSTNQNTPLPALPTISFANAISLERLAGMTKHIAIIPQLGALFRYNSDQKNWSPGLGASWSWDPFSFGVSFVNEKESGYYPETKVVTTTIGLRLALFQLEYASIRNTSEYFHSNVTLIAISGNVWGVMLSGAYRGDQNPMGEASGIYHFAAQYVFTPKLALAYFYNYVPGYQSLAAQVLF